MGYYFVVIGIAIAVLGGWASWGHLRLAFSGRVARGEVVAVEEKLRFGPGSEGLGRSRKRTYYHPVIEFQTAEARRVMFTYGGGSTREGRWRIRESVDVLYDPRDPRNATIRSFLGLWAGPLAVAALAAGTLSAGVALIRGG